MILDKVYNGNNIDVLKTFEDNSIDSIVTDPPYGISFMNKHWDYDVPTVELWKECLRVLKPGGHMLVACGTRTQHRMAVNIEDAGFEVRDIIAWIYGSGFPKSHDISKAIESKKLTGKSNSISLRKTEQNGKGKSYQLKGKNNGIMGEDRTYDRKEFKPSTEEAKQYEGWGTALKPAMELWTLARKPIKGTVADNVMQYGTGGINIDGCRVELENGEDISVDRKEEKKIDTQNQGWGFKSVSRDNKGRFPANVIHDGSEEVVKLFPDSNGAGGSTPQSKITGYGKNISNGSYEYYGGDRNTFDSGSGSAARFFYTAKASQTERNWGGKKNIHPTVKPLDLMRYLVRLITPKGGVCLDPFLGSGTTAVACKAEKFNYIGIELMPEYVEIAEVRIKAETVQYDIFDFLDE